MEGPRYGSAAAFKQALEQRLKDLGDLDRRRQLLVYDRFLARATIALGDAVTLKGGLGLEIRLRRARTTRDVDLRMAGSSNHLLLRLQALGRLDLGDFMSFEIEPHKDHPVVAGDGVRYHGQRFTVRCALVRREYGRPFGLDIGFADPMLGPPDRIAAADVLAFAGIPPPVLQVYPVVTHIAEKLHAYTLPRPIGINSRLKDLPDIALLGSTGELLAVHVSAALTQTFGFRATHAIPTRFPDPPKEWLDRYRRMASDDRLPWPTLPAVTTAARDFLEPVLSGLREAKWSSTHWAWHAS